MLILTIIRFTTLATIFIQLKTISYFFFHLGMSQEKDRQGTKNESRFDEPNSKQPGRRGKSLYHKAKA